MANASLSAAHIDPSASEVARLRRQSRPGLASRLAAVAAGPAPAASAVQPSRQFFGGLFGGNDTRQASRRSSAGRRLAAAGVDDAGAGSPSLAHASQPGLLQDRVWAWKESGGGAEAERVKAIELAEQAQLARIEAGPDGAASTASTSADTAAAEGPPETNTLTGLSAEEQTAWDFALAADAASGFLGKSRLQRPGDLADYATASRAEAARLLHLLVTERPQGRLCVRVLDRVSDVLCQAADPAHLAGHLHEDRSWARSAGEAEAMLHHFIFQVNADAQVYGALLEALERPESLSPAELFVAEALKQDFDSGGIHLPDHAREELLKVQGELHAECAAFTAGSSPPSRPLRVSPTWALAAFPERGTFNFHSPPDREKARAAARAVAGVVAELPTGGLLPGTNGAAFPHQETALRQATFRALLRPANQSGASGGASAEVDPTALDNAAALLESLATLAASAPELSINSQAYLPYDPELCTAILQHCPHPGLRRQVAAALGSVHAGNRDRVVKLSALRSRLADLLGCRSYAERTCGPRSEAGAAGVVRFLLELSREVMPIARGYAQQLAAVRDADPLRAALQQRHASEGDDRAGGSLSGHGESDMHVIDESDAQYYGRVVRGVLADLADDADASAGAASAEEEAGLSMAPADALREYLPLDAALSGIELVLREAFGLDLTPLELGEGECWAHADNEGTPAVSKFVVSRADGGAPVGVIYLDLFDRPGKMSGAAHFVVRCGRRMHALPAPFGAGGEAEAAKLAAQLEAELGPEAVAAGTPYQLPVVALATRFAAGSGDSSPLLSPSELVTLFHEMGHALHSLLSRTEFQHTHGTRTGLDFAEVPSHLFECFVNDYRVLSQFARHHRTGEPLPERVWRRHQRSTTGHAALSLQRTLCQALFDMAATSDRPMEVATATLVTPAAADDLRASGRAGSDEATAPGKHRTSEVLRPLPALPGAMGMQVMPLTFSEAERAALGMRPDKIDPDALSAAIHARHSAVRPPDGSALYAGFPHLASYAASYYVYLQARVVAAALWDRYFAPAPLSRSAGRAYTAEVLERGGETHTHRMLEELLGGRIPTKPFLRHLVHGTEPAASAELRRRGQQK